MRIVEERIAAYARELPAVAPPTPDLEGADDEARTAFSLQLNAINFGSGWFPTIRKRDGLSGYRTMEAGLRARGPWTAPQLRTLTRDEIANTMGQDPKHVLMGLFETHLRELGTRVGGSFLAFAQGFDGSAEALATELSTWPTWSDVSPYPSGDVPLFKRAQIAAADLALAGIARRTTCTPDLVRGQPRPARPAHRRRARVRRRPRGTHRPGHAARWLAGGGRDPRRRPARGRTAREAHPETTTAAQLDWVLWTRGAAPRYKAHPRHRAPTTAY